MGTHTQEALFQGLVLSLAASAMQHLGKTLNPLTQKIEKNLEAAQDTIDMLDMLESKTRGNLSNGEAQLLKRLLADLKMNYVETLNEKPEAVSAAADGAAKEATQTESAAGASAEPIAPPAAE